MAIGLSKLVIAAPVALVSGLLGGASTYAQVATDGTVGPRLQLAGPDFQIGADLGTRAGRNLFHSFERFSLATGERATFSGPDQIRNVISRVTGGARSDIDGTLRSTIPGADLYFFNPAGVVFGPNASLDLQGSFHVSTADELRFSDGTKFSATNPAASSFTVAAPEAFGFLGPAPAPIRVQSGLVVPDSKSFSLVGGDIDIIGGGIVAPAGHITLVGFGGRGAVSVRSGEVTGDISGRIRVTDGAFISISKGDATPGTIMIEGERVILADDSSIFALNDGMNGGLRGGVTIRASELSITNFSEILIVTFGDGDGIPVTITANEVVIDRSQIVSDTMGGGDAGAVIIDVSGNLKIAGRESVLDDGSFLTEFAVISSSAGPGSEGAGAAVTLTAENIVIGAGALISSDTLGSGDGGSVTLKASDTLMLSGLITTTTFGVGASGQVSLRADTLHIRQGALASDSVGGGGDDVGPAGDLLVRAGTLIIETGGLTTEADDVFGGQGQGQGGRIVAEATELIDLFRAHVTSDGALPGEGDSLITLTAPLIALNNSVVTSLTGGVPIEGSGEARILGDLTMISADSEVAASSTVEITGQEADLGSQVVTLEGTFIDTAPLRARCGARRDIGASSFTGVGRAGLPPSPDGPLASAYVDEAALAAAQEAGSRLATGTAPADVRLARLITPCAALD